jgi:hypothetical protein
MLDTILRAHYTAPKINEDTQVDWLRALVSALAQARNGETAFVVKLDAWSVFELNIMRKAFPDTPWVYLYRDPLEIAVSQLRERGAYMIPGMLGPSLYMFDQKEVMAMCPEEFIARVLGKMLEAGHAGCLHAGGRALHYRHLPQAVWTGFGDVFGIRNDAGSVEKLQKAARWNAKHPQFEFVEDTQRKLREATPALRDFVERWATPAYRALESAQSDTQEMFAR